MPGKKHGKQIPPNGGASVSKKIPISISDKIQIVMVILTFLSLIGVLLTLKEMQVERNAAYNPTILMNASDFSISWDSNGQEGWLASLPDTSNSSYEVNSDGSITGTISLSVNIFPGKRRKSAGFKVQPTPLSHLRKKGLRQPVTLYAPG